MARRIADCFCHLRNLLHDPRWFPRTAASTSDPAGGRRLRVDRLFLCGPVSRSARDEFFSDLCGDSLVRSPHPDDHLEADPAAEDEAALYAVEALRDPEQSKNLVGFREEKRVLVYFLKSQKKAKASARR